jgi:hypothetical protein
VLRENPEQGGDTKDKYGRNNLIASGNWRKNS